MARKPRTRKPKVEDVSSNIEDSLKGFVSNVEPPVATSVDYGNQTSNTNTNTRRMKMPLDATQIAELLANSRTKGLYNTYLAEFIKSGDGGVCVNEERSDLKDKKASTLKQGFENAKSSKNAPEGADKVRVITNDELVYLLNVEAAGVSDAELPQDDEVEDAVTA